MVHSRLVRLKTLVDKELGADWAVLVNLLLHVVCALCAISLRAHAVAAFGAIILAALPVGTTVNAAFLALRGWLGASAIAIMGGSRVMSTRFQLVGLASRLVAIVAAINDASSLPVLVNCGWNATVATHISMQDATARCHIRCRQVCGISTLAVDANAVCHRLSGAMGPAAAAFCLISDLFQAGALGSNVLLPPIEISGEILDPHLWGLEREERGRIRVLLRPHE